MKISFFTLLFVSLFLVNFPGRAQETFSYQPTVPLPIDPETVYGRLDNGMTYYIRKNNVPAQKVELRLVFNAGSILESDDEQGLSHFLEHMSFTGTTSFPGNELVQKLEGIGVRLGYGLNAYTNFDETVYYLTIPAEHLDLGMTIVQEWAMNLALTEPAIDRERGVVIEELRLGKGAPTRIREKYLPVLFAGSAYPKRLPIGKEEVIAHFDYEVLRNFYKKWHRPDLTALIVTGDIDPSAVEKRIKQQFSTYEMPKKPEKREHHYIPDHKDLRVIVATDKETTGCSVEISYKHKPRPVRTQQDYRKQICHSLYSSMVNARLAEQTEQSEAPFTEAETGYSNYFRDVDTYSSYARCPQTGITRALTALTDENERIIRYGFSETELERAKKKMLSRYGRWYNERDKTASDLRADECQVHFLSGTPMPGIAYEYEFLKSVLPQIRAKEIHRLAKEYMTRKNRTIIVTGPEGDGIVYPSASSLKEIVENASERPIQPYDEGEIITELMNSTPQGGTIVAEKKDLDTGLTEWTLSNGVKVVFKITDFKNNEILFRANSNGGYSMYDGADDMSALYATRIQDESGVNGINNTQLKRLMAGKDISITQSLILYHESMSGKFAPNDIKEFFQLIHLYHTAPYFERSAYDRVMKSERSEYAKLLDSPNNYFNYQIDKVMSNGNNRRLLWPLPENLDRADFERAQEIYKSRFGNAAGFTYIFVGNIDPEQLKTYVLTYLGSLPTDRNSKPEFREQHFTHPQGPDTYLFRKGVDDKANVAIRFVTPAQWDKQTDFNYNAFIDILNSRLYESLRIEMSGVYGVRISGTLNQLHEKEATLNIGFGTNTAAYEKLYERTLLEIDKLIQEGPTQAEVDRVKEKRKVALATQLKQNASWLLKIFYAYRNGVSVESETEQWAQIETLTPETIQAAGKKCVDTTKPLKFVLLPEK